ncbi:hypothetical protein [Desulfotruncus alcoholivorax]|uniref:hypothetical protein n=1 Tax=Desulfotruncus alcoholivorax TaxID=265477 RepID=UPI0004158B47|nr:hypothetical protein [Desulfotruncus alcoholivorax]
MRRIAKKLLTVSPVTIMVFLVVVSPAAAAGEPEFVTGFKNLLNDATSWILGLIPVAAGAKIGYHALMKNLSQEEEMHSVSVHNKGIKNALVGGAIGVSATLIVKAFLSYF